MATAAGDLNATSTNLRVAPTTMTKLTILDGDCLLGQHLITAICEYKCFTSLRVWNAERKHENRLASNNNVLPLNVHYYVGSKAFGDAIYDADVVINAREYFDASNCPDDAKIDEVNRRFVEKVTACCQDAEVKVLIQLSSVYVQCTPMWPNVYQRETNIVETGTVPFESYVRSKGHAESRVLEAGDDLRVVIARIGPLYGEGDLCSPVCDAIKCADKLGYLPVYGDRGGVIQMTYAGNVAHSLLQMASSMLTDDCTVQREVVTIRDDTPLKDIYTTVFEPLVCRDDRPLSTSAIPFYILFPLFVITAWTARLLNFFGIRTFMADCPQPVYLYFLFRHWTCFSNFRMQVYFDLQPKYDYQESLDRCYSHYNELNAEDIRGYSWLAESH